MVKPPVYNMTRACSDKKCAARPLGRGWVVVNNHSHSRKAENDDEFWQLHLYLPSLSLVDEKHSSVLQLIHIDRPENALFTSSCDVILKRFRSCLAQLHK